jgi:hypothetical protein
MRDHLTILKDIEQYLSNHSLTDDLQSLQEEVQASATGGELCSRAGTWLLTFQVYSEYDQTVQDLINEFIEYCHSNGIYPR